MENNSELTYEKIYSIVEDVFNSMKKDRESKSMCILLHTGRGGAKQFIIAALQAWGMEVNLRSFIRMYKFMVGSGWIQKVGNAYRIS